MDRRSARAETRWLRRALAEIEAFDGRGAGPDGLGVLRDRLTRLAWLDGCPTAAGLAADGDDGRFRRHPIAQGGGDGVSALLMYWPPGHASLPHDHGGLWGIEVALDGTLDVDEYVRTGSAEAPGLTHVRSLRLAPGEAAVFAGEEYVHRCRNRSNAGAVLTLHVYGGALGAYTAFRGEPSSGRCEAVPQVARDDAPLIRRRGGC